MRNLLVLVAIAEAVTGVALLLAPGLVGQLLLGTGLTALAALVGRVAGVALIGLGIACWPGPPILGMMAYSGLVAIVLGWAGYSGLAAGAMLWPVVVVHVVLTGLLLLSFLQSKDAK